MTGTVDLSLINFCVRMGRSDYTSYYTDVIIVYIKEKGILYLGRKQIMKRCLQIFFMYFMAICLLLPAGASAHSGRTDKNGGHKDNKNVSGLGPYHYHCGGHPAHLHPDGVCPYKSSSSSGSKKTAFKLNTSSKNLTVGASFVLKVSGTARKAVFTSSDTSVAAVKSGGKVTAKKKGTAVITARIGTKKKTCKVNVEAPVLSRDKLVLTQGQTGTLKLTGTKQKIAWSSSNEEVAGVENGKVYAYEPGTAVITALAGKKKYNCRVTVKARELVSIGLKEKAITIEVEELYLLEAYTTPEEMIFDLDLKWSSSDPSVATVEDGEICGIKAGTAVITVSYGDKKAACTVTVEDIKDDGFIDDTEDIDDEEDDWLNSEDEEEGDEDDEEEA